MKILIVPDVHGRKFWRKAKEVIDDYDRIIFLGDYLDPYSDEGINPDMAYTEFMEIIRFKLSYPKKVILLLGNHDLHYYLPGFIPSTRYNYLKAGIYHDAFKENKDLFTCFKQITSYGIKFLFSHAGINKDWLTYNKLTLSKLLKMSMDELLDQKEYRRGGILEQVPWCRGGDGPHGSPVWADITECRDGGMSKFSKVFQIAGHSRVKEPLAVPGIIYTDCQKLLSLDTKTMELNSIIN